MDSIKTPLVILTCLGALALAAEATYARPPSEPHPTTEAATTLEATVTAEDVRTVCDWVRHPSNRINDFKELFLLDFPEFPIYESHVTIDDDEYQLFLVEGPENDVFAYLKKQTSWIGHKSLEIGVPQFVGYVDGSALQDDFLRQDPDGLYDIHISCPTVEVYPVLRHELFQLIMGRLTSEDFSDNFNVGDIILSSEPGGHASAIHNNWTEDMKALAQEVAKYVD